MQSMSVKRSRSRPRLLRTVARAVRARVRTRGASPGQTRDARGAGHSGDRGTGRRARAPRADAPRGDCRRAAQSAARRSPREAARTVMRHSSEETK